MSMRTSSMSLLRSSLSSTSTRFATVTSKSFHASISLTSMRPATVAHEILAVGQPLAPVLREHWRVERIAFLFTGGDIAHAHAHVLPLVETTDITSRQYIAEQHVTFRGTPRVPDSELAVVARALRAALANSRP